MEILIVFANLFLLCLSITGVWGLVHYWSKKSIKEIKDRYPEAYRRHYKDSA
jgi:hypothetical protein